MVSALSPNFVFAATKAERVKACLTGSVVGDEKQKLIEEKSTWTYLFSDYAKDNVAGYYTFLTGKPAAFVDGTGLVLSENEIKKAVADR